MKNLLEMTQDDLAKLPSDVETRQQIGEKMKVLENVTRQITESMNRMAADSSEITQSVNDCQKLSNENQTNLEELNKNVGMFKI